MQRLQVLFVVPYPPSLVRVRPYSLIRELSRRGHRVTVATLWTTEEEREDIEALRPHCERLFAVRLSRWRSAWNCLRALPTGDPLQARYCWHPEFALLVQQLAPSQDVVHIEHLRGARFALPLLTPNSRKGAERPAVIWDSVDCISYLFEQAARKSGSLKGRVTSLFDLGRTRRYEGHLLHRFNAVLVTSPIDRKALQRLGSRYGTGDTRGRPARIDVVPNGVDLDYFAPPAAPREPATLVISGKMSYHANVSAVLYLVREIMPAVWARRPDVRLWIVGKDPAREICALAGDDSGAAGRILVTGTVPDLRPYLRRATVSVAPLRYGAGIQNKVLEAMACATPVVASRGAVAALAARPGVELQVADTAGDFADQLLGLLDDPDRRVRLGQASRAYVEQHHAWPRITARLESIYAKALNGSTPDYARRG